MAHAINVSPWEFMHCQVLFVYIYTLHDLPMHTEVTGTGLQGHNSHMHFYYPSVTHESGAWNSAVHACMVQ